MRPFTVRHARRFRSAWIVLLFVMVPEPGWGAEPATDSSHASESFRPLNQNFHVAENLFDKAIESSPGFLKSARAPAALPAVRDFLKKVFLSGDGDKDPSLFDLLKKDVVDFKLPALRKELAKLLKVEAEDVKAPLRFAKGKGPENQPRLLLAAYVKKGDSLYLVQMDEQGRTIALPASDVESFGNLDKGAKHVGVVRFEGTMKNKAGRDIEITKAAAVAWDPSNGLQVYPSNSRAEHFSVGGAVDLSYTDRAGFTVNVTVPGVADARVRGKTPVVTREKSGKTETSEYTLIKAPRQEEE